MDGKIFKKSPGNEPKKTVFNKLCNLLLKHFIEHQTLTILNVVSQQSWEPCKYETIGIITIVNETNIGIGLFNKVLNLKHVGYTDKFYGGKFKYISVYLKK